MIRIGIVDDHAIVRTGLRQYLSDHVDLRVTGEGASGHDALEMARGGEVDVLLLDISMPDQSGVDALAAIKARFPELPVLILSARDTLAGRVAGLDSGADDYLEKPYNREELLARIRALLRRHPPRGSAMLTVGDLRLNPDSQEAIRGDREVELTKREFELLEYLILNHGRVPLAFELGSHQVVVQVHVTLSYPLLCQLNTYQMGHVTNHSSHCWIIW